MKLSIIIPVMNQHLMTRNVIDQLVRTIGSSSDPEIIVIDNGSDVPFRTQHATVIRHEKSIGVYPTFDEGFKHSTGDIVAFFHSDLVIWEDGWVDRVIEQFESDEDLGMIGFIGSSEIDWHGGRGLGTTSNFRGLTMIDQITGAVIHEETKMWRGSDGAIHGKVNKGFTPAVVVDGCAMIIRRQAWNDIGYREGFPPHHFYDRLISTQLLEKHWKIGVLGIGCDHFSGQTVNQENSYVNMAANWAVENDIPLVMHDGKPESVANVNWDASIYQEAERRWLKEYRDMKHIVPIKL